MTNETTANSLTELKAQARRLRSALAEEGVRVSHSGALEMIARQMGERDWNTLSARRQRDPVTPELALGQRVRGAYLGHGFEGRIRGLREIGSAGHREVIVQFDAPIDVVRSSQFSAERRQVSCVIDGRGRSPRKTSDGEPILLLEI